MRRLRLSGKPRNTGEIQLEIRRVFDRKLMDRDAENEALKREKRATERTLESVRTAAMPVLAKQLASKPRRTIALKYFGLGLVIVGIGAILALVGWKYWESGNDGVAMALWTVAIFEILFPFFWKVIPNIRKEWQSAGELAEEEARRLLKEST